MPPENPAKKSETSKATPKATPKASGDAALKKRESAVVAMENKLVDKAADLAKLQNALKAKEADLAKRESALEALAKKVEATAAPTELEPGSVRIIAKRDGFWRAGISHPAKPVVHGPGTFNQVQLAQLKEENERQNSQLVVEFY